MTALVDSGFLYAIVDQDDKNHDRVMQVLASRKERILLPTVVLTETTHLLAARRGHLAMCQFIRRLAQHPFPLVSPIQDDFSRIYDLLEQYADLRLDFVDATVIALAERFEIRHILTVDQRDFRAVRPKHCPYFEILP